MYKDEKQKKFKEMIERSFEKSHAPMFIRKYFVRFRSKVGAASCWYSLRVLFLWLIERDVIHKKSIAELEPKDFLDVTAEDITIHLEELEENGISPVTTFTKKARYKSFWDYLVRTEAFPVHRNIILDVPYEGIRTSCLIKKYASEEQIKVMEENILRKNSAFYRIRNHTILRVLKGTGISESELCGLDLSDLHLKEKDPYIVILGKGKYRSIEVRNVFLTKDAVDALEEWLAIRNEYCNADERAVFIGRFKERLNERGVINIFTQYGDGIRPHMIRHYYATAMASYKGGLAFAQQQLGHASIQMTTMNYVNGIQNMRDVLSKL